EVLVVFRYFAIVLPFDMPLAKTPLLREREAAEQRERDDRDDDSSSIHTASFPWERRPSSPAGFVSGQFHLKRPSYEAGGRGRAALPVYLPVNFNNNSCALSKLGAASSERRTARLASLLFPAA